MPFSFTIVMIMLFSALTSASVWAIVQSLPLGVRSLLALIGGMAPMTFVGWTIYHYEGDKGGSVPLNYFYISIGVSFICALLAIIAMEWRLRHK